MILFLWKLNRIILAALVIALKYNEDCCYKFDYYSYVGGVSTKELLTIEYNFLELIDYELYVNKKNYQFCLEYLELEMSSSKEKSNKLK